MVSISACKSKATKVLAGNSFRNEPEREARQRGSRGFTLIELLISIVILMFISIAIYQATNSTFRLRESITAEGDFYNSIRLSMNIMQQDIELMFTPLNLLPPKKKDSKSQNEPPEDASASSSDTPTSSFFANPIDKTGVRPTRFIGSENKISFFSASNRRTYKDSKESEFAKITYELVPDPAKDAEPGTQMLMKTVNLDAFAVEDDPKSAFNKRYPLLRGIRKLRFRFYQKDKEQWQNAWDSIKPDFKNKFPDIVEISCEIRGPTRLTFEGVYNFRPEIPQGDISASF